MFKEFKEFAMKGSVLDLAIGVVIGAAFSRIITSLVDDIINPILGLAVGRIDLSNLFINLSGQPVASLADAKQKGAAVIAYGSFINSIIGFLIVAVVLFLIIRAINRMRGGAAVAAPTPTEALLTDIRDLLKAERRPLG